MPQNKKAASDSKVEETEVLWRHNSNNFRLENEGQKTKRLTKTGQFQQHITMEMKERPEMHCKGNRPSPVECHFTLTSRLEMTLPGAVHSALSELFGTRKKVFTLSKVHFNHYGQIQDKQKQK